MNWIVIQAIQLFPSLTICVLTVWRSGRYDIAMLYFFLVAW